MGTYKSACQLQRFLSVHDQVANQFMYCRYNCDAKQKRELRAQAFAAWNEVACAQMATV
jgi:putative transposase